MILDAENDRRRFANGGELRWLVLVILLQSRPSSTSHLPNLPISASVDSLFPGK
jgi:hypothetical protein